MSNTRNYAYLRVSTREQTIDRQMDALKRLDIEINERDIFVDEMTGTTFDRPNYQAMKLSMRPGDTLYIQALDRLGRNKVQIKEEWQWFTENDIDIYVIDTPLISTINYKDMGSMGKFVSDLILEILSWLAEEEIEIMKKRQREGIEAAKERGVVFGRPKIEINDKFIKAYNRWERGSITAVQAMEEAEMTKSTFYRRVKEYEESLGIRKELPEMSMELINAIKKGNLTEEQVETINKLIK